LGNFSPKPIRCHSLSTTRKEEEKEGEGEGENPESRKKPEVANHLRFPCFDAIPEAQSPFVKKGGRSGGRRREEEEGAGIFAPGRSQGGCSRGSREQTPSPFPGCPCATSTLPRATVLKPLESV
jgi:hypothetical protein